MSSTCIECNKTVRPRQEGLKCDGCDRWQHRTCNTGISEMFTDSLSRIKQKLTGAAKNVTAQIWATSQLASQMSPAVQRRTVSKMLRADLTMIQIHLIYPPNFMYNQVPLVYVLMTRRRTKDYKKVFKSLKEILPEEIKLTTVTVDFEQALWLSIRDVFPGTEVKGCFFHWSQALWRKVQHLGLQRIYQEKGRQYRLLRKIFALPLIPAEHIYPSFQKLTEDIEDENLKQFMRYVEDTWLTSEIWNVEAWCMFNKSTRTNNDCEGWHRRLNYKSKTDNLPFYILVPMLHEESIITSINVKLVTSEVPQKVVFYFARTVICSLG